eukprot:6343487-Lingulodinium_polyedra.AAC.1
MPENCMDTRVPRMRRACNAATAGGSSMPCNNRRSQFTNSASETGPAGKEAAQSTRQVKHACCCR